MDSTLGTVGWRRGGQLFTVLIAIACMGLARLSFDLRRVSG